MSRKKKAKDAFKGNGEQAGKQAAEQAPRTRQRGASVLCPACGADAFVFSGRSHPSFVSARRLRYYRCGDPACGKRFKR